jgi:lysophospholipase L1-like esterase
MNMRHLGFVLVLAAAAGVGVLGQEKNTTVVPGLKPGARVAVVGDSITEQKLYSQYIELYLTTCMPQLDASVMQFGWGGERANGFAGRLDNDLMPFKPTLVTTCYGMNDGGYRAYEPGIGKAYEVPLLDGVKRLKAAGVTVIVGSPGAVDTKYFRPKEPNAATVYNENLAQLRDIAKKIAADEGMIFANVHDPLMAAMAKSKAAYGEDYDVCGRDGVHPGPNGHLIMAYAFLKAMGFDGDLGGITIDLNGKASAVNGHVVVSEKDHAVEIESSRYPFCLSGDGKNVAGTTLNILPFVPFQQDLNRLTLVVKNAKGDQVKVVWGDASKIFARADLEKGINLAAEFPVNPFCGPFKKVEAAVSAKQNYETFLIKSQINPLPQIKQRMGDDPAAMEALAAYHKQLWNKEERLQKAVRAAMAPVRHTITIVDPAGK